MGKLIHVEAVIEVPDEVYDHMNQSISASLGMPELQPLVNAYWKLGSLRSADYLTHEQWLKREGGS